MCIRDLLESGVPLHEIETRLDVEEQSCEAGSLPSVGPDTIPADAASREQQDETVDFEHLLADQLKRLAEAVTPNVCGSKDAMGGHVESLTEAVMGMTAALSAIATATENVAEAIGRHGDS